MMMPILFQVGPLRVYTLSFFLLMAFLWGGFVINKKAHEYHIDDIEIYDGLVISMVMTVIFGKLLSMLHIVDLGIISLWVGILVASLLLARKEGHKLFTVLDIFSLGAVLALSWWSLGIFWSESAILIFGVVPVQLLLAMLYALSFIWLWRIEKVYRTYGWYRGRKVSANTGFVFGSALIVFGLINLVGTVLTGSVGWIVWLSQVAFVLTGIVVIYWQSGRGLQSDCESIVSYIRTKGGHKKSISVD